LSIMAAVYNSLPADPNASDPQHDNRHGTNFRVSDPPLLMIEAKAGYDVGLPGTLKLGGWKEFNDFTDQLTDEIVDGSHGLYAIVDQQIWKDGDDRGISVFGRISGSPDRQNAIDFYFDAGIVFSGLVPGRPKDAFGAAFGYGEISSRLQDRQAADGAAVVSSYESVLEINYTAQIMSGWTVTPDVQYFWNPGGKVENPNKPGEVVDDTVVFGVRTNISY
jgi:porin